ncbi:MAG: hypothetical protein A2104_01545 [Candidatus Melainabacteria bacterium GWF2_32_7]|nr:MAG: hypothetical protein A2104_01545 [Candidatus Melainabacteria bacterium GWF2_32_7]
MQNQYLLLAENITYKNNKLSCINIIDQLMTIKLPSEFQFDLVAICGPGWSEGDYAVSIRVQLDEGDVSELGKTQVKIPNDGFTYNALASDLKVFIPENAKSMKFYVYRNDELMIERRYQIASLFIPQEPEKQQEINA